MRGRKPLPSSRRALDGNAGRRPLNTREPKPDPVDATFDTPPSELADDARAMAEWARLVPVLRKANLLTKADRGLVIACCKEWSRYLEAMAKVTQLGLVVKAPSGYPIVNPYLSIGTRALAACNKMWPELGLTPSSRTRIGTTGPAPDADPFAEFDEVPDVNQTH